jgi:hypothetical protein
MRFHFAMRRWPNASTGRENFGDRRGYCGSRGGVTVGSRTVGAHGGVRVERIRRICRSHARNFARDGAFGGAAVSGDGERGGGCDLAMMCAQPESASQRNAERNGFRVVYTRIKWGRAA